MATRKYAHSASAVLAAVSLCLAAYAGQQDGGKDGSSMASRKDFIENFTHISLDTTAADAMLLRILVQASGAKRGVEVGTARAFGAVNMGIGFERTGGRLLTIDIDPKMVEQARRNLGAVGLSDRVEVIEGDALKVIPALKGEYDFVFLDAVKSDYDEYFAGIEEKLVPGAVIAADNTIQYAGAMKGFLGRLFTGPAYDAVTVRASMKKRDGMTLAWKVPPEHRDPDPASRLKHARDMDPRTAVDTIILRILAEVAGAHRGTAVGASVPAALDMGIAFERTGGRLSLLAAAPGTARAIKTARLEKTVSVDTGDVIASLRAADTIDFLCIDAPGCDYRDCLEAAEPRMPAGSLIVVDSCDAVAAAALVKYLAESRDYDTVRFRPEDKQKRKHMAVAWKIR